MVFKMFRKTSIIISLVVLLGVTGCGQSSVGLPQEKVTLTTVSAQTLKGNIMLSGVFDSDQKTAVTSQLPGKISNIMVKEGSFVKKGDALISLDQADLHTQLDQAQFGVQKAQSAVDQAKIAYDYAQDAYTKSKELLLIGTLNQPQMDQITMQRDLAKSQYETALNVGLPAAKSAVETLNSTISKTVIVSSMDGVVVTLNVVVGDNVSPGIPLATIVSAGDPVLVSNISESSLNNMTLGQKAEVQTDSLPDTKYIGEVSFISSVSIATGQLFPIKVKVQDPTHQLKLGMTASANIQIVTKASISVPNSAIIMRNGKPYVYLVKDGTAHLTAIQIGFQGDIASSVIQGLKTGDSVVGQGTDSLIDGMKIPA